MTHLDEFKVLKDRKRELEVKIESMTEMLAKEQKLIKEAIKDSGFKKMSELEERRIELDKIIKEKLKEAKGHLDGRITTDFEDFG